MSNIEDYRLTKRGSQGVLTIKTSDKNGNLAKILAVNGDEDILVVTNLGIIIRTSLKEVKVAGRNTLGVRIIKLANGQNVSSLCVTDAIEEETEIENKAAVEQTVENVNEQVIESNDQNEEKVEG